KHDSVVRTILFSERPMTRSENLRAKILELVGEYYAESFATSFVPGQSTVPVSGKVFDADELQHLVDASLDFWLTTGRFAEQFETEFAAVFGLRHAVLVNSGSWVNLLALSCLTSPVVEVGALRPGGDVLSVG